MRKKLLFFPVLLQIIILSITFLPSVNAASLKDKEQGLQNLTVSGIVRSAPDNLPLPGVNVTEKGTQNGTITDVNGRYNITVSNSAAILQFSFIGYITKDIPVNGKISIDVTIEEDIKALDEVVVVGYGVQKKRDVTGSISHVNSEQIENTASPQIISALQGKAAGVFIMNNSGKAGGDLSILIRGVTSLNGTGPLWVIDGVPGDPGMVNMNDVASIDIIKDGTAAAIYGVKAAAGVILVTTKRGADQKKPKISFNAYSGISKPWRLPEMVNSDEYVTLKNEQWSTSGVPVGLSLDSIGKYQTTDWMKEMFKTGKSQNYDLDISGSNEQANYYLGFTYYKEEPSFVDNSFQKYSIRFNSDYNITKWLKLGESMNLLASSLNPVADEGRYLDGLFRTPPMMPVYDAANQPGGFGFVDYRSLGDFDGGNPMATQLTNQGMNYNQKVGGNAYATATIIPGLKITATFAGNMSFGSSKYVNYPYKLSDRKNYSTTDIGLGFGSGFDILGNVFATYEKEFGKHNLSLTAGYEASKYEGKDLSGNGINAKFGLTVLNQTDVEGRTTGGGESWGRSVSQFGRATYQYANKYILRAVVRRDGSDKFGPNNRFGVFPSLSAAWKINEEEFMKNITSISFLKLRGGYGVNGNDNIGQYKYTSYMVPGNAYPYGNFSTVSQNASMRMSSSFPNRDIQWEESIQLDGGIDLGLFRDKLFITADIYKKSVKKMLFYKGLPFSSGLGNQYDDRPSQVVNAGLIFSKGIEFTATYKGSAGDLRYTVNANVSSFNYTVKELTDNNPIMINPVLADQVQVSRTIVGETGGFFYGYMVDGIFQTPEQVNEYNTKARDFALAADPTLTQAKLDQIFYNSPQTSPGDLIYVDQDGNGIITQADRVKMGSPWPKAIYGLQITANYKWFDLLVSAAGIYKRDVFNAGKVRTHQFASYDYSTSKEALTRWTPENHSTTNYRIYGNDANKNMSNPSSWYIEDGSYFRLKNIQLGMTLPKSWSTKVNIEKLRIYVSGQNLVTLTKYSGYDPEFGIGSPLGAGVDGGTYPSSKIILIGIQLDI